MNRMELAEILQAAVDRRTSDIHLTVGRPPMFRIDGDILAYNDTLLKSEDIEKMAMPIMSENQRADVLKKGEADFAYTLPGAGRFRVNIFRQKGAYAMVLRLLPVSIPMPESLGLPECVIDMTNRKRGLVLVTGCTGSGKSTTLASLINVINHKYSNHVITLEDPIEYVHNHAKSLVNQREIGSDTQSYANALRAALRQDPDCILVGEMRDLDTISTAITAAETGHLVFSTLHTLGAASTIDRCIDVFPPHQQQQIRIQLATVLECVVSQQLIPLQAGKGRVAAFEILLANPAIRNLIREGKTFQIPSIMQTSKKMGMLTMDDAIYDLFMTNQISREHAIDFAQDPVSMHKKIF